MLLALAMIFGLGLVIAQPASAGPVVHDIKVTVTQFMCPKGGTVKEVNIHISEPGSVGISAGDTASGLSAFSAQPVEIDGANYCSVSPWWRSYWNRGWVTYRYFWFNGQHTYI